MSSVLLRGVPVRRVSHAYVRTFGESERRRKNKKGDERKENERSTRILSDERGENIEELADLCASGPEIKIHESSRERDAR